MNDDDERYIRDVVDRAFPDCVVIVSNASGKTVYDHKPRRRTNWLFVLYLFFGLLLIGVGLVIIFWRGQ